MNQLEAELSQLKEAIIEMMKLATKQLQKSHKAIQNLDIDLSQEVIHRENRMNAMELSIDRDCENMFALWNPVATDLRFVLAMLKINSELERIGDHAAGLAKYVLANDEPFNMELTTKIELNKMYEVAIDMMEDVTIGFNKNDTTKVRKVFKKDLILNDILKVSSDIIGQYVETNPSFSRQSLFLFSALRKLERVGDLTKNIAEQIIFYLEAEVVRHKVGEK
jgi:phosphate transport system protein